MSITKFVRTDFFKDRLCCLLASAREIFFSVCYIILYFKQKALNVGEKILLLEETTPFCGKDRSSHPEAFLGKGVLKICSKFTGEHPCRNVISINLLCNFA